MIHLRKDETTAWCGAGVPRDVPMYEEVGDAFAKDSGLVEVLPAMPEIIERHRTEIHVACIGQYEHWLATMPTADEVL